MGAIHELLDDYRHYRQAHPEYRLLFLLGDLASLVLKLAVFAGFLYLCWYLVSRNPQVVESPVMQGKASTSQKAEAAPELTAERIALLEGIAGSNAVPGSVGSVSANSGSMVNVQPTNAEKSATVISKAFVPASFDQSPVQAPANSTVPPQIVRPATEVQVESRPGRAIRSGYTEIDDIPTVAPVTEKPETAESNVTTCAYCECRFSGEFREKVTLRVCRSDLPRTAKQQRRCTIQSHSRQLP